jgi:hypothetical protein
MLAVYIVFEDNGLPYSILTKGKQASLFWRSTNDEEKKFYNFGTRYNV